MVTLKTAFRYLFLLTVSAAFSVKSEAVEPTSAPLLWRMLIPASATTQAIFLSRSPQFVLFSDGRIVYRDDTFKNPYQQIQLSKQQFTVLWPKWQQDFGLFSLVPDRLKRETPYIQSVQKPLSQNNDKVSVWIGVHSPPSLHTYSVALLEARAGNVKLGPAWDALYRLSGFLATFAVPTAEPYHPDRVELAVQELPAYRANAAPLAVEWSLKGVSLAEIKGQRSQGFRTLTGETARQAYLLLSTNEIVKSGGVTYLVWVRPLLMP